MNFFGHATVAGWRSRDPAFVLGSMLPDFTTMLHARAPRIRHAALAAGVRFHHATDRVFHESPIFLRLQADARRELRRRGIRRGSALAVAHVGVELLLDGELARDAAARRAYLDALGSARYWALEGRIDWDSEDVARRFRGLCDLLESRGVSAGGADPGALAERLRRALAGRPRLALEASAVPRVAAWVERARPEIAAAAAPLAAVLRTELVEEATLPADT